MREGERNTEREERSLVTSPVLTRQILWNLVTELTS